jgi:hypothetical protein
MSVSGFRLKGMIESRRRRARGVSRFLGDKVIEDGLHAGWFERIEQSHYVALESFAGAMLPKARRPVHRSRMG